MRTNRFVFSLHKREAIITNSLAHAGSAICGIIISQIVEKIIQDRLDVELSLQFLSSVLLLTLNVMMYFCVRNTQNIAGKLGFYIQFCGGRTPKERKYLFSRATEIVNQAKESIYALNTFMQEYHGSDTREDETVSQAKSGYYEALIRSISRGVKYRRILQIPDGRRLENILYDNYYIQHFREIINSQPGNADLLSLKVVSPKYNIPTFLIIDETIIVLQIDQIVNNKLQMAGIIIIEDPRREITNRFCTIFNSLDNQSSAVKDSDLPKQNSQESSNSE
jgi:hypothetical protein